MKERAPREAGRVAAFLSGLMRGFSQLLSLTFTHPTLFILILVKYNKYIPTIISKFSKDVTISYRLSYYCFEPL